MVADSFQERQLARRFFDAWPDATVSARTRARRTMMGGVGLRGFGLQPLRDLVPYGIRPAQDRVDCVAQRAKLSPVHRLSPSSKVRVLQIGRDHPLVKFVDPGWSKGRGVGRGRRIHARGRAAVTLPAPHHTRTAGYPNQRAHPCAHQEHADADPQHRSQ